MDLMDQLNNVRQPLCTRVTELRPCTPYRVVKFDRCTTRLGEAIAATLEGLIGDDFYLRVFLPDRFKTVLSDDIIIAYNNEESPRLSLQYLGREKGTFKVNTNMNSGNAT